MKRRPPTELNDFWEIFLRRRWWILLPPLLISAATVAVVSKLPKVYRSETLILVEPQKVPADYIKPTVSTDVADRLLTISQEIMSRTRLQKIIDQFGLYGDKPTGQKILDKISRGWQKFTQEDAIEEMRKDITVDPIVDPQQAREHAQLGAFRITYQGSDPALAQQVTRQIASLYIEENLRVREQQAEGTSEFIDTELEKAGQSLEVQEKRLRDFKAQHMGVLPEQQEANLHLFGELQTVLQANTDALTRTQDQKTYLESLLSTLTKRDAAHVKPLVQSELEARRTELGVAEQKYKSDHPDVMRLQGDIKALEKLVDELGKTKDKAPDAADTQAADQIRSQMASLDREIKERTQRQEEIENKIKQMQARIEQLPTVEQQLSEISRDYVTSKASYQSLLEKKNSSGMAAEMERRAKGEQFRILDPASYPEKPFKPDVAQITLLGCLGGVLCGFGLGFLMEYKDKSLNNDKDAAFYLAPPLITSLPVIVPQKLKPPSSNGKDRSKSIIPGSSLGLDGSSGSSVGPSPETAVGSDIAPPDLSGAEAKEPGPDRPLTRSLGETLRRALALRAASERSRQTPPISKPQVWQPDSFPGQLVVSPDGSSFQQDAFAREQFRMARTRLLELMRVRTVRTLMVTSAVAGEGKTLVAANLAFAMSHVEGLKVLLLDADLQKASLGRFLKIKFETGLSTCLLNGKGLGDARWQISSNLAVVPTNPLPENSAELLNGRRMRSLLEQAIRDYDLVVVDAPPLLPVADAQVLTSLVDAAILVVRARYCPYDLVRNAVELLQPKVIGIVLNAVERFPRQRYYHSYYNYNGDSGKRE